MNSMMFVIKLSPVGGLVTDDETSANVLKCVVTNFAYNFPFFLGPSSKIRCLEEGVWSGIQRRRERVD